MKPKSHGVSKLEIKFLSNAIRRANVTYCSVCDEYQKFISDNFKGFPQSRREVPKFLSSFYFNTSYCYVVTSTEK